jgi:hypothetical protein
MERERRMAEPADGPAAEHELLAIYLHDHRAGAAAALQLMRRCRRHAGPGELAATLAWLESEVDEDRRTLDAIMEGLDIGQSAWKTALSVAVERAGRLKSNGRVFKRSPLSTLLEFEAITAAVYAKRNLWLSLAALAQPSRVGDARRLGELAERANTQLERLQAHHEAVAQHAFGSGTEGVAGTSRTTASTNQPDPAPTGTQPTSDAVVDQLLADAEGGIEGSLLDAPTDAGGTPR